MLGAFIQLFLFGCARDRAQVQYKKDAEIPAWISPQPLSAIVVYDSWSGNTQLIAESMAEAISCPAIPLNDIDDYPVSDYDLLMIGSPVHSGMPTDRIKDFLNGLETPHRTAVFVTFGAPFFGPFAAEKCLNGMEKRLRGTCIGRFKCHGFHQILGTYPTHPDEKDRADAARFATGLITRCKKTASIGGMNSAIIL